MSYIDSLGLPVIDMQLIEKNKADLQTVAEMILNERALVMKKGTALLSSKSDNVRKLEQTLKETRLLWEDMSKQRDVLESAIESAARSKLQCRVKQQEVDIEKNSLEAKCNATMQELTSLKNDKEKLISDTQQKWAQLVYASMHYKQRLNCHITLDKQDENVLTFEFFQIEGTKEPLYYVKLNRDQDGKWALLDMHPQLSQFNKLCKYLEVSQDVQRLVVYLHHKFGTLRDSLLSDGSPEDARMPVDSVAGTAV